MKAGRLPGGDSFTAVFDEGKSIAGRFVVLYYRKTKLDSPRVGFAVGKRLGGAVQRNRIRRRLREAFRLAAGSLKPYDLVLVARSAARGADFSNIKNEIKDLLQTVGLYQKE